MRRIGCNREAVSNVLGYLISFMIASSVMISAVLITTDIIDDKTISVAEVQAQSLANKVADALAEAVEYKQSIPDAAYQKTIDIPTDLAGKSYYIETTSTRVYVNTTDGTVSKSSTTYSAEDLNIGISGTVYSGGSKLNLLSNKSDFAYKLDFGTGNSTDHSPVESGYYMVSNRSTVTQFMRDPPWWNPNYHYRIPIKVENDASEDLDEVPVKIVLDTTNFDYSHTNVNVTSSSTVSSDLVFVDSGYGVVAEVEISPDTWYTWWIKGYLIGDIDIEVTITELSDGYSLSDIDGDTIKLNGVSRKSWDGSMATFDPQEALLSLGDDPTLGEYTITISGSLNDWTPFYGGDDVTVALADILVDDDAYLGWYDATHVKTVQEGIGNASSDDAVFVYAGTYDENVVINKKVNLFGEDKETTIIDGLLAGGDVVDVAANDVYIDSFGIRDGSSSMYPVTDGNGIKLSSGLSGVTIRNCDVYNNGQDGIKFYQTNENTIINCDVYWNGNDSARNGICLVTSSLNTITNCNVHHQEGAGIGDEYPDGIDLRGDSNYNLIENCSVHNMTDDGIDFDDSSDHNTVRDCSIRDNGARGIQFQQDDGYNTITNCNIYSNDGQGIVAYESSDNTIENCEVYQNSGYGIWIYGTLASPCKGNKITNCNIYENGDDGVNLQHADDSTISNCDIYGNGDDGIYFWKAGKSGEPNYITNCNVYDNTIDGIIFHGSNYNEIKYCNVFDNGDDGVHLIKSTAGIYSTHNTIKYCNFYGNGGGTGGGVGVWIDVLCNPNYINYNNFAEQKNTNFPIVYNAYDIALPLANDWDDNYWDDYTGGGSHVIPPNPGNTDNNPNSGPEPDGRYSNPDVIFVVGNQDSSWCDHYHVETIQEGIDNVTEGGSVYVYPVRNALPPPGAYSVSSPITIDKEVNLIGKYSGGLIKIRGSGNPSEIIDVQNDNVHIESFEIYYGQNGIYLDSDAYDTTITNCYIHDNDYGIYTSSNNNEITNCAIYENDYGIYFSSSDSNDLTNCDVHDNDYGIYISDSSLNRITYCDIYSNTQHGIYIDDSSNNYIVDYNSIRDNGYGVYLGGGSSLNWIEDCDIYSNTQHGIYIDDSSHHNWILSCDIYSNTQYGIYINDSSNYNEIRCDIHDNEDGIGLNSSEYTDILNCDIYSNTQYGIYLSDSSNNNRIVDRNNIRDNDYGIYISDSSSNEIHHNNFEDNNYSAYDTGSNTWDNDYGTADPLTDGGNHWDDYDEGYEGAYDFYSGPNQDILGSDGIVDTPYPIPGGDNEDGYPFGGGEQEARPYYIDYWNPYGNSIILVNMSLKSLTFKYIYLYYGYDRPLDDFHNHSISEISVFSDDFNTDLINPDKWIGIGDPSPVINNGRVYLEDDTCIHSRLWSMEAPGDPPEKLYSKTVNDSMYIVEARVKINEGQGNMFFLAHGVAYIWDQSYMVSANVTPADDFTLLKMDSTPPNPPLWFNMDNDLSVPDLNHWLRMKSYIYMSKTCYKPDPSTTNFENTTVIDAYLYNYETFADEGNVSGWDTDIDNDPDDPPGYLWAFINKNYIGLGAGLQPPAAESNILVDWVRVMKTPIVPPTVSIGSMESSISNYGWTGTPPSSGNRTTFDPFNPGPVLCDFNYGATPAIFVVNLPVGTYTITVTMGDEDASRGPMNIKRGSTSTTLLTIPETEPGEFETKCFTINWDGGDLNLEFSRTGTNNWAVNSMLIERGYKGIKVE